MRKLLRAVALFYLPAFSIMAGFRVFAALKVGAVRFIGQDHVLIYRAEPVGFVLAVAFYALISALCFGLLVFWFVRRPLRLWPSIALTGAILFGIFAGVSLAPLFAKASVIMAPLFGKGPVIERPPPVRALIARLRTSQVWAALDDNPISCGRVPKRHPPRDRCYYRSAGLEVLVAWNRQSGQPSFVSLEKREPRNASPFAWADLATTFHLLCTEITPEQAASLADEALEALLRRSWTKWDSGGTIALSPEIDGAHRSVSVRHGDRCVFDLFETTQRADVHATLRFRAN